MNTYITLAEKNQNLINAVIKTLRWSNNAVTRKDLFQEGFIALMQAEQDFRPDMGKFSTFGYIYVRNHLQDYIKSKKNKLWHSIVEPIPIKNSDINTYDIAEYINNLLRMLHPYYKKVLREKYWDGHSLRKIAVLTGEKFCTVNHRHLVALQKLRSLIEKD